MSDPRRLLDGGLDSDGLEATLLQSARVDAPSARARLRTGLALGVVAGTLATVATPASMAAVPASVAASTVGAQATATTGAAAGASAVAKAGAAVLLKWVGAGIVTGALAIGAVHYVAPAMLASKSVEARATPMATLDRTPGPKAESKLASGMQTEPPPAPADVVAETAGEENASPSPPQGLPHEHAARAHAASVPVTAPVTPTAENGGASHSLRLADEVALLDHARSAVAGGQADEALRALDRHDHEFSQGPLAPEADVVRVEALVLQGRDDDAMRGARAFLAANPASPQAQHVRSLVNAILARHEGR